jgi:peptide/nickel transport system ATP-binding protein
MNNAEPLLKVENLQIKSLDQTLVQALSFQLAAGKTLGIVGESGSGKSLTSFSIMGLLPPDLKASGKIIFDKQSLLRLTEQEWTRLRGRAISMIFQEPMTALNPSLACGEQVAEILQIHTKLSGKPVKKEVLRLFEQVELPRPESIYKAYPHQISGGQKQRVMIAMAIACKPKLLIADEPTTALDVSVQSGILKLLNKLQKEYGMAMLFISHDLAIVRRVADQIMVMQQGQLKEMGPTQKVFKQPEDLYTKGLLACRPSSQTYYKRLPLVRDFLEAEFHSIEVVSPSVKDEKAARLLKQKPLFEVKDLSKTFSDRAGWWGRKKQFKALKNLSFAIYPGESLGLVGESGSGKTTLGRILVGLEQLDGGSIYYNGKPLHQQGAASWRQLHKKIQIIFQDPFSSLNPRIAVGEAIAEVLRVQGGRSSKEAKQEAEQLLEKVGLLKDYYSRYPHEFSGGQRQRIGIARALATKPQFIVCDESVSALDVSVQAQILNLLNDLKEEFGLTYLFISHDLNVVRYFSDRILVLESGQLVESGLAEELYRHPRQEYTQKLIAAIEAD